MIRSIPNGIFNLIEGSVYYTKRAIKNGLLYNYLVATSGIIAPASWHVPTATEWATLSTYLGGDVVAGGKMKETGIDHWSAPNTGADNSSNFTGYGTGVRAKTLGFIHFNERCNFWRST